MKHILKWLVLSGLLISCGQAQINTPTPTLPATDTPTPPSNTPTNTPRPTLTPMSSSPTPTPTKVSMTNPAHTTTSPCVTLYHEGNAQVELVSSGGSRVLVDVYDSNLLSSPATGQDALLTTHNNMDHIDVKFQGSFPGEQLMAQAGTLELPGVNILGIASAHNAGDELIAEGGTNYTFLVEMDGLRIAHFGDIGQDVLTPEQLSALGEVDVAITQLVNPYSFMSVENQKGFKLMDQVNPLLIIPTHFDLDSAKLAVAKWQGLYNGQPSVTICKSDLPGRTSIFFTGEKGETFADRLNLTKVDW